ncbi:response regulator [Streptomyces qinglanensis]|uniref:DNA-binding response regulator, NarL/FixJ family, contains REC and HTH domains n=1 Tax=Streptomyces qinglanensis TaxID=943816 RepID=A0A1H9W5M4_9ACTN|nr:response regulator transcription factor [Streptomyces qinglanensis]SES29222.1 DNA-binding response regulator, NarL/FixJ family, contains REC and HTH domains [Streptomyces qinglanensis]
MTIRVLIADDQETVRRSMRRILEQQADIEVVGEAADGAEALEAAIRLRPDVALLDVRMPRADGLEVTRRLLAPAAGFPGRVVIVTTFDLDEYVYPALRYGASGFLLKRSGPTLLVEAVRAAVAGDSLISPSITVRLLRHVTGPGTGPGRGPAPGPGSRSGAGRRSGTPAVPAAPAEPLTKREGEIAGKVGEGLTNADIAAEMFISPGTVKTHVASIQRKLGVRNRVGIAVWAWEKGYVTK